MAATLSLLMLSAACVSTPSGRIPVDTEKPAEELTRKSRGVVSIPERDLVRDEAENLWGADRSRLALCSVSHNGLIDYTLPLVSGLQEAGEK